LLYRELLVKVVYLMAISRTICHSVCMSCLCHDCHSVACHVYVMNRWP